MAVDGTTDLVGRSIIEQLEAEFSGRAAPEIIRGALLGAARDLQGSIRWEVLAQMAFVLAQFRLARDTAAPR